MTPATPRYATDTLKGEFLEKCHQLNAWLYEHDRFEARINELFRQSALAGIAGDLSKEFSLRTAGQQEIENKWAAYATVANHSPSRIHQMTTEHRHLKVALAIFEDTAHNLHPSWDALLWG